ncbi:hypothetical protein ACQKML_24850 [Peribacillus frigoritolerans]
MNIEKYLEDRDKRVHYVDKCKLMIPEEVAQLFEDYTKTIWDFKLVGRINDFYSDDIVINREGGSDLVGVKEVFENTLHLMAAFPDLKLEFIDIFAEGNEEDGYSFGQAIYFDGINTGYSKYGPPTGKSLTDGEICLGLCECRVEKVNGRWKIVEEWVTRSSEAIEAAMKSEIPKKTE